MSSRLSPHEAAEGQYHSSGKTSFAASATQDAARLDALYLHYQPSMPFKLARQGDLLDAFMVTSRPTNTGVQQGQPPLTFVVDQALRSGVIFVRVRLAKNHERTFCISPAHLPCISPASHLHLTCISAVSRLHLGRCASGWPRTTR